jgi:hypothetical protein
VQKEINVEMLVFPTNTVGIYTGKTVNHWVGGLE